MYLSLLPPLHMHTHTVSLSWLRHDHKGHRVKQVIHILWLVFLAFITIHISGPLAPATSKTLINLNSSSIYLKTCLADIFFPLALLNHTQSPWLKTNSSSSYRSIPCLGIFQSFKKISLGLHCATSSDPVFLAFQKGHNCFINYQCCHCCNINLQP